VHVCYLGAEVSGPVVPRERHINEPLRLAYIGMMGMSYDLETLLQSVRDLVRAGLSAQLEVAGTGPKEEALRAFTKANQLEDVSGSVKRV